MVVAVIAAAVTVIGTLILHTVGVGDAVDWRALVASGIIGFAVAITIFFWTRVEGPAQVHKEQTEIIAAVSDAIEFVEYLKKRRNVVFNLWHSDDSVDSYATAMANLGEYQKAFILLLRRTNSKWTLTPKGWAARDNPVLEWAGLCVVMEYRYGPLGEVTPLATLYSPRSGGAWINPKNFVAAKNHTLDCMDLVIRETIFPNDSRYPRMAEPDTAFDDGFNLRLPGFTPAPQPAASHSSPSASPPSSPSQPPPPNHHRS
jgi:hypothetical protein